MDFLVLHGGPGLNSYPEHAILGPHFEAAGHRAHFWNEPSRLRPNGDPFHREGAFENWIASAERLLVARAGPEPVALIAHSVATVAAIELARRHPLRLSSLVLVSPCTCVLTSLRNILVLAHQCAADEGSAVASRLAECVGQSRAILDDAMRQAFDLILENPRLLVQMFSRYWVDQGRFRTALAAQACTEAQFDPESFFSVLEDLRDRGSSVTSQAPVKTPTLALFAEDDPVCKAADQVRTVQSEAPNNRIENVKRCGHFLHLEQPAAFVQRALDWALSAAARPPCNPPGPGTTKA